MNNCTSCGKDTTELGGWVRVRGRRLGDEVVRVAWWASSDQIPGGKSVDSQWYCSRCAEVAWG